MKKNWLVIFLAGSLIIHLILVFVLPFKIKAKNTPVIYGWPNIVDSRDLFSVSPKAEFSTRFIFSLDELRRNYFSRPSDALVMANAILPDVYPRLPEFRQTSSVREVGLGAPEPAYFYLWERPRLLSGREPERVSYRIFVSKQGKVLFIYPDKLISDASGLLRLQEYIRSASFFLNKNFFWTNIEAVVE